MYHSCHLEDSGLSDYLPPATKRVAPHFVDISDHMQSSFRAFSIVFLSLETSMRNSRLTELDESRLATQSSESRVSNESGFFFSHAVFFLFFFGNFFPKLRTFTLAAWTSQIIAHDGLVLAELEQFSRR